MEFLFSDWNWAKFRNWLRRVKAIAGTLAIPCIFITGTIYYFDIDKLFWSGTQRIYWKSYSYAADYAKSTEVTSNYKFILLRRGNEIKYATDKDIALKSGDTFDISDARKEEGWLLSIEPLSMTHQEAYSTLRNIIYDGRTRQSLLLRPFWVGFWLWVISFGGMIYWDKKEIERKRIGKIIRGTQFAKPNELKKLIQGDGIGIPYFTNPNFAALTGEQPKLEYLKIRHQDETSHILVCGDTRQGKSVFFHHLLYQIRKNRPGTACIVYDPAYEFFEKHFVKKAGEFFLAPGSEDCPYWDLPDEIQTPVDAAQLARSFIPSTAQGKDFFERAPQQLLTFLLEQRPAVEQLLWWLENTDEVLELIKTKNPTLLPLLDPKAGPQRAGVLATLNLISDALKLLPKNDGRPKWSARQWVEGKENGWLFLGMRPHERDALRPLISAWMDMLLARLMVKQGAEETFCFVDELPTLQRLPKLKDAIQEGGKYNLKFVLGFQGRAQLETLYEKEAETLMSAPETRLYLKTKELRAAEWIAGNIGKVEIEQESESLNTSLGDYRDSMGTSRQKIEKYLVLPVEIQNLDKLMGYLRYNKYLTKIRFSYLSDDLLRKNPVRQRQYGSQPAQQKVLPGRELTPDEVFAYIDKLERHVGGPQGVSPANQGNKLVEDSSEDSDNASDQEIFLG